MKLGSVGNYSPDYLYNNRYYGGEVFGDYYYEDTHNFEGWYSEPEGGIYYDGKTTEVGPDFAGKTLYAHWSLITYTVTLDPGAGSVDPTEITIAKYEPYTDLPTPVRDGYTFDGWFTEAEGGDQITAETKETAHKDHILYAHWTPGTYTVTFAPNGGAVYPTSKSVTNGSAYGELPTPLRNSYLFIGWHTQAVGGDEITSSTIASITGNQTLYAHWRKIGSVLAPTVTTNEATDITKNSARLSGTVNDDGGDATLIRQLIYWDKFDTTSRYSVRTGTDFAATVRNLSPGTQYYYYAQADNSGGSGMGSVVAFTTEAGAEKPTPQSVTVSPNYVSLKSGEKYQLLATVLPAEAENRNVVWSSSNTRIVKVDADGMLTALRDGSATITVTTEVNRLTASCTVKVSENVIEGQFDFSEWNMATNTSSYAEDGFSWDTAEDGGNVKIATSYLVRWDGAVLESGDKYPSYNGNSRQLYHEVDADYHVQEVLWLPNRETGSALDNDEIKAAIMNYGAVYESFLVKWAYFDNAQKNYYYPENGSGSNGGHAIAVVGWDDNYPASNFVQTPPGNGAFICKNSWGTGSGEDGYFYISYYDKYFGRRDGGAVVPAIERNTNYNKIYQYDPYGACSAMGYRGTTYAANVFPQNGTSLSRKEILRAVSFYTSAKNTAYEVYVVTNYQDSDSLEKKGPAVASGTMTDMGYHTVKLDRDIELNAGTRFAVIIKLSVGYGSAYVYYEYPSSGYSDNARANTDESYFSYDGADWRDLARQTANANFCIKAFTDNGQAQRSPRLFAAIDNDARSYESDQVYTVEEALAAGIRISDEYVKWVQRNQLTVQSAGTSDDQKLGDIPAIIDIGENSVSFVEGAILPKKYDLRSEGCVTNVKDQGSWGTCWAFATYASLESCLLKKSKSLSSNSSMDSTGADDYIARIGQYGVVATALKLSDQNVTLAANSTYRLQATFEPANATENTVIWSSSDESVATVDTNGTVTAHRDGTAEIQAANTDGTLTAVCTVTVGAPGNVMSVTLDNESVRKEVGDRFIENYTINPTGVSNADVTWKSNAPSVVSVNENGLMEAKATGIAIITVTTDDGGYTDTLAVRVSDKEATADKTYGVMGTQAELEWSYDASSNEIKLVDGEISKEKPVLVAVYDEDGRMISIGVITQSGDSVPVAEDPDHIKIFWVNSNGAPLCGNGEIENK